MLDRKAVCVPTESTLDMVSGRMGMTRDNVLRVSGVVEGELTLIVPANK